MNQVMSEQVRGISDADVARPMDWLALIRPRLASLGLGMVVLSYAVAAPRMPAVSELALLIAGSAAALCASSVLNQVLERGPDGKMRRTADRPLPTGRIHPWLATTFAVALGFSGLAALWFVHPLTSQLAAAGMFTYVVVYTPLKSRTSLSTIVGAVPGAIPVLMGWSAARGSLDQTAWALFAILFLWQMPHFLAIAWMYRADYERAGFRMLTAEDPSGDAVVRQAIGYSAALVPASMLPTLLGTAGGAYLIAALALSVAYLLSSVHFARRRTGRSARRLLLASVIYLPLLFGALALDVMIATG